MSTKRPVLVKYLTDPKFPGRKRQMQVFQLYPLLGLNPSHPIPKDFTMEAEIEGVKIVVKKAATDGKKFRHRIYAVCPDCQKEIPFGRMQQHSVVHSESRLLQKRLQALADEGENICTELEVWAELGVNTVAELEAYMEPCHP